jgi:hypothetical protein
MAKEKVELETLQLELSVSLSSWENSLMYIQPVSHPLTHFQSYPQKWAYPQTPALWNSGV